MGRIGRWIGVFAVALIGGMSANWVEAVGRAKCNESTWCVWVIDQIWPDSNGRPSCLSDVDVQAIIDLAGTAAGIDASIYHNKMLNQVTLDKSCPTVASSVRAACVLLEGKSISTTLGSKNCPVHQ
jgi:hypothetical protein